MRQDNRVPRRFRNPRGSLISRRSALWFGACGLESSGVKPGTTGLGGAAVRTFLHALAPHAKGGRPTLHAMVSRLPSRFPAEATQVGGGWPRRDGSKSPRQGPCPYVAGWQEGDAQPLPDKSVTPPDSSNPLPVSNDGDQGHAISVSASIPRRRESAIQWKHAEASRYVSPSWIQRSGPLQSMCYRQGPPG
jgi:hypothetical protein